MDIVFSRWTTPILWTLNNQGRQRFIDLQRRIATITPKVLTQRLRQLERDGLVVRTYYPEVPTPSRVRDQQPRPQPRPLFAHLAEWATTHLEDLDQARRTYDVNAAATRSAALSTPVQ